MKTYTKKQIKNVVYSTDARQIEGIATGVFFPRSEIEIQQIIRAGNNFVARGAGSGLVGGSVPQNSVVIDLSKMNRILKFDKEKGEVEVEAGIILDELNDYLSRYGLEFPVNPSSHAICTIGGMIATNAVGSRAVKYGKTSNWLREIEVVDGNGNLLEIGKADLSDFSGLEGITGIIVKAKLKLVEKKYRSASLFKLDSVQEAVSAARKLKMEKNVSMIEFFDKTVSSLFGLGESYHILTEFEGDEGNLKDKTYEEIMKIRDNTYPSLAALGYVIIEDPKIFLERLPEFAEYLEKEKVPFFGHLGEGIIHPVFLKEDRKKIREMLIYVRKLHGKITGEHGIGLLKKEFVEEIDKKIYRRLKKRYDPECKINCGKIFDYEKEENKEDIVKKNISEEANGVEISEQENVNKDNEVKDES